MIKQTSSVKMHLKSYQTLVKKPEIVKSECLQKQFLIDWITFILVYA